MTDKELIKQELERRIKEGSSKNDISEGALALDSLLSFINSLPEEPASEDLEEEVDNYFKDWTFDDELSIMAKPNHYFAEFDDIKEIARHFAEWQREKDLEDSLKSDMTMPNKFYEKGRADAMNEIKEAVETTIVNDWQYGKDPDRAIIPAIHQRIEGFDVGDKVRILILKED